MFTLRRKHFEDGGSIYLISQLFRRGKFRSEAIIYELKPLGFTRSGVACRVNRFELEFTEGCTRQIQPKKTVIYERVDVSLDVKTTLTDHIIDVLSSQIQECDEDIESSAWFADLSCPTRERDFKRVVR